MKMNPALWRMINAGQTFLFFFWSVLWQSIAIVLRFLTLSPKTSLWLARRVWAPPLISITGSKVMVQGREAIDFSSTHIFVFNHQSTLDIAVAFKVLPVGVRFIAKKELKNIPFLGWYMQAMGMIFIDRRKVRQAKESLDKAVERIRRGANIIAFPEGTRSPNGRLQPFKKGIFVVAIQAGVPIVPVAIEGTREVMPKNSFLLRPHPIRVAFGEPIPTEHLSYPDRDSLMHTVREQVSALHLSIGGRGEVSAKS